MRILLIGATGTVGRAVALEARGIRVNVVSPPWVAETLQAMGARPLAACRLRSSREATSRVSREE